VPSGLRPSRVVRDVRSGRPPLRPVPVGHGPARRPRDPADVRACGQSELSPRPSLPPRCRGAGKPGCRGRPLPQPGGTGAPRARWPLRTRGPAPAEVPGWGYLKLGPQAPGTLHPTRPTYLPWPRGSVIAPSQQRWQTESRTPRSRPSGSFPEAPSGSPESPTGTYSLKGKHLVPASIPLSGCPQVAGIASRTWTAGPQRRKKWRPADHGFSVQAKGFHPGSPRNKNEC
jgi:hypothetical protein